MHGAIAAVNDAPNKRPYSGGKLVWGFSVMNDFKHSSSNDKKAVTDNHVLQSLVLSCMVACTW